MLHLLESDKIWLAAMIDGEGCISGRIYKSKYGYTKTSCGGSVFINTDKRLIDSFAERLGNISFSITSDKRNKKEIYHLYITGGGKTHIKFLREIFPYLISKKEQALFAIGHDTLLNRKRKIKRIEKNSDNIWNLRKSLIRAIQSLNQTKLK